MLGFVTSQVRLPLEVGQAHVDIEQGFAWTGGYARPSVQTLPSDCNRGIYQKLLPSAKRKRNGSVGWVTRPNAGGVVRAFGAIW